MARERGQAAAGKSEALKWTIIGFVVWIVLGILISLAIGGMITALVAGAMGSAGSYGYDYGYHGLLGKAGPERALFRRNMENRFTTKGPSGLFSFAR